MSEREIIERTILSVLRSRGPGDFGTLYFGFLDGHSEESVQRALQRLKRRGLIRCDRRWWSAVAEADEEGAA